MPAGDRRKGLIRKMLFSLNFKRVSSMVVLVGLASFALTFAALTTFAPGWAADLISSLSATAAHRRSPLPSFRNSR